MPALYFPLLCVECMYLPMHIPVAYNTKQIYQEDIITVCANGAIVRCPGLFNGEMIVMVEHSHQSIIIAMNVAQIDIEDAVSTFRRLIAHYPQCIFTFYLLQICTYYY